MGWFYTGIAIDTGFRLTNDCKAVNFTEHPNIKEDISQQNSFSVLGFDVLTERWRMERFLKIFGLGLRKMVEKSGPIRRHSHDVIAEQTCWRCICFMSKSAPRRTRQERVTQRTSSETRLTCRDVEHCFHDTPANNVAILGCELYALSSAPNEQQASTQGSTRLPMKR